MRFEQQVRRLVEGLRLELRSLDTSDIKASQKVVDGAWPHITIAGRDVVRLLDDEDDQIQRVMQRKGIECQEVYLGWDPDSDLLIQGHDCWDGHRASPLFGHAHSFDFHDRFGRRKVLKTKARGGFYGRGGVYKYVHERFPNLIDLRLD